MNSFISPSFLGKNIFEEASNGIPTRDVGRIEIKFTPRAFPTPVRESQSHLEEEVRCISYYEPLREQSLSEMRVQLGDLQVLIIDEISMAVSYTHLTLPTICSV